MALLTITHTHGLTPTDLRKLEKQQDNVHLRINKINKTKDIFYMYPRAYKNLPLSIHGYSEEDAECMFFGQETDKFHIALYY